MESNQQYTGLPEQPHVVRMEFISSAILSGIAFIAFNWLAMITAGIMSALFFSAKHQPAT